MGGTETVTGGATQAAKSVCTDTAAAYSYGIRTGDIRSVPWHSPGMNRSVLSTLASMSLRW
ncbi:hypothetical protein [Streptomyces sp. NPDC001070]